MRHSERITEAGIKPSVGGKGDSYDNAMAETINGLYTAEVIHRRSSRQRSGQVELETLDWMDWYNNRRLMGPLGYTSPSEYESRYYDRKTVRQWLPDSIETASENPGAVHSS